MSEPIMSGMEQLNDLLQYHSFITNRSNPPLSYETWKRERPIITNPQTYTDLQKPLMGE